MLRKQFKCQIFNREIKKKRLISLVAVQSGSKINRLKVANFFPNPSNSGSSPRCPGKRPDPGAGGRGEAQGGGRGLPGPGRRAGEPGPVRLQERLRRRADRHRVLCKNEKADAMIGMNI